MQRAKKKGRLARDHQTATPQKHKTHWGASEGWCALKKEKKTEIMKGKEPRQQGDQLKSSLGKSCSIKARCTDGSQGKERENGLGRGKVGQPAETSRTATPKKKRYYSFGKNSQLLRRKEIKKLKKVKEKTGRGLRKKGKGKGGQGKGNLLLRKIKKLQGEVAETSLMQRV